MNDIFKCLKKIEPEFADDCRNGFSSDAYYPGFCSSGDQSAHKHQIFASEIINSAKLNTKNSNNSHTKKINDKNEPESLHSERAEINCQFCPYNELYLVYEFYSKFKGFHRPLLPLNLAIKNYAHAKKLYKINKNLDTLFYLYSYSKLAQIQPPDAIREMASLDSPKTLCEIILQVAILSIDAQYSSTAALEYKKIYSKSQKKHPDIFSHENIFISIGHSRQNEEVMFNIMQAITDTIDSYNVIDCKRVFIPKKINNSIARAVQIFYELGNSDWVFIACLLQSVLFKMVVEPNDGRASIESLLN